MPSRGDLSARSTATRNIFCCGCQTEVQAYLVTGKKTYPHRRDLHDLPFWRCDTCGNFVGCHHKTRDRTRPLGCIPTPEIKVARQEIHKVIDPIWKSGRVGRRELYGMIAHVIGVDDTTPRTSTASSRPTRFCAWQEILERRYE